MGKKKMVMRRLAALLAASLVLTSSAFTSLAATGDGSNVANEPKLTLTATKTALKAGEEATITAKVTATASEASRSNAEQELIWEADSDLVTVAPQEGQSVTVKVAKDATVKENTVVTITAKGTLELDGETAPAVPVTGTCELTVMAEKTEETKPVAKLAMNPETLDFVLGDAAKTVKAVLTSDPAGSISESDIKWSVEGNGVIQISGTTVAERTVTAIGKGTATIVATVSGEGYEPVTAKCVVTVTEKTEEVKPVATLKMSPESLALILDGDAATGTVKAVLTSDPVGSISENDIKWSVVDGDGVIRISGTAAAERTVTAVGKGHATVVATVSGEGYEAVEARCEVTVTKQETVEKNNTAVENKINEAVKELQLDTEDGAIDTSGVVDDLTDDDLQEIATQVNDQKEEVMTAVKAVDVAEDVPEEKKPENQLGKVFGDDGIDGVKAEEVVVKVEAAEPKVKVKVTKSSDGTITATVVVTKVTFNIDLVKKDNPNEVVSLEGKNTKNITVPVMIPEKVDEDARWATITHKVTNGRTWKSRILGSGSSRYIDIIASHFSPFDITFSVEEPEGVDDFETPTPTPAPTNPGGYSGGGRSSGGSKPASNNTIAGTLAGQWQMNETGWWFRLDDGSYAVNSWQYVAYNGVARWYRFDANGYICKGWFTDADGHRYYLNPVSDGLMGSMLTGWQQIDGIWYYFNTASDGTQGALLVNTTTPDGYNVDANGQWIQ